MGTERAQDKCAENERVRNRNDAAPLIRRRVPLDERIDGNGEQAARNTETDHDDQGPPKPRANESQHERKQRDAEGTQRDQTIFNLVY